MTEAEILLGTVIADAIRTGQIHLPRRDEAVVMAWADDRYSF